MRPWRWGTALVPAVLILAQGCKSTPSGGDGDSSVPGPGTLSLEPESDDVVWLRWDAPSGTVDGFLVEGHGPGQPFSEIPNGRLGPATLQLRIIFSQDAPELAQFEFRVRSRRGSSLSVPSNVVSYQTPIRVPSGTGVGLGDAGINVVWGPGSALADHVSIERTDDPQSRVVQRSWSVPTQGGQLFDDQVAEATKYWYRFRSVAGDRTSSTVALDAQTFLWSAVNLRADSLPGAVRLTWENRSLRADQVVVTRNLAWDPAQQRVVTLDAGTTSWVDTDVLEDVYSYEVAPTWNGWSSDSSPLACGAPSPDGGVLKLRVKLRVEGTALGSAMARQAVLLPDDTWCFFNAGTMSCQLADAGADEVTTFDPQVNVVPINAVLALEGTRDLHAFYTLRNLDARTSSVIHEARTNGQWTRETLVDGGWLMSFARSSAGVEHALWFVVDPNDPTGLLPEFYDRWDEGRHSSVLVPWTNSVFGPQTQLAAGPTNEALVAVLGQGSVGNELKLVQLFPDGGSSTEVVPAGTVEFPGPLEIVSREDAGALWIAYQALSDDSTTIDLRVIERRGGTWLAPVVVRSGFQATLDPPFLRFVVDPTGNRQAIEIPSQLFVTTDGGWTLVSDRAAGSAAFQVDGGLHLFLGTRSCSGHQLNGMAVSLELME
jgi:hypothetical protein